ncbi:hypothetical protein YPPY63_4227, partial [Yersinia pestis PY-63]
MRPNG